MTPVAALFVRKDSIYKTMPGVDAWDAERDAMNWPGGCPVVAHPPCGQWGRLAHMAHDNFPEKWMALLSVAWIRMFGGVLEHPRDTRIRAACKLPRPGTRDAWGGWSLVVSQKNWGHPAEKATLLYVVGCEPRDVPAIPMNLQEPPRVISSSIRMSAGRIFSSLGKREREAAPPRFAEWLVELARRCEV